MQERRNSIANALELRLSCTNHRYVLHQGICQLLILACHVAKNTGLWDWVTNKTCVCIFIHTYMYVYMYTVKQMATLKRLSMFMPLPKTVPSHVGLLNVRTTTDTSFVPNAVRHPLWPPLKWAKRGIVGSGSQYCNAYSTLITFFCHVWSLQRFGSLVSPLRTVLSL